MEVPEGVKITRDDITAYRWTSETGNTGDPGRVGRDALILEQDLEVQTGGFLAGIGRRLGGFLGCLMIDNGDRLLTGRGGGTLRRTLG